MSYKEDALDFLGITKWHKEGYTGKGIKIMSDEKVCRKTHSDVISPAGFRDKRDHGDDVMTHIKLVAPDATFIAYPMSVNSDDNGGYVSPCIEYIKNEHISIFTTSSTSQSISDYKEQAMQDCIDSGCIFFAAAGNKGSSGIKGEVRSEKYWAIGGVKPVYSSHSKEYDWNSLKKTTYSSIGDELDYVTIAEILSVVGTSFCAPVFAGMCGLVQQFFFENAGRKLTKEEMELFVKDNLIDVDEEGFDIRTGNGLFVLPEIEGIDIARYVSEVKKMKICLDAGHGISTPGKRSPDGSLLEYEFNRDVALRLKRILEEHGVEVILTAYDDVDVPLASRCKIANTNNADYFVSIHANAYGDGWNDANGWEIFIVGRGGKAEELAECIHKHSINDLGLTDRGVKEGNFQVLRDTDMPAVLIEHGFYTNKEECAKLKTDEFRQKCAIADAKGILEFLGIEYKEVTDTNVGDLILTIDKKEYTINGETKTSDVAPKIENGRTLVPIYLLRELGLTVEWNAEKKEVTICK